ncbi:MAG TPA: hypothetical protein VGZ47_17070 [Gemmataceae bacterium]|jgi:multidrug resistance efflux pump|nr:hypothetical protein [Gemmataceae bacterium]
MLGESGTIQTAPPAKRRRYVMNLRRVLLMLGLGTVLALAIGVISGAMLTRGIFGGSNSSGQTGDQVELPSDATLTVSGDFDVHGGPFPLSPVPQGLIKSILVREGQRVEANAPLIELDATLADQEVKIAEAAVRAAQLKTEVEQQKERNHKLHVEQAKLAVKAAEERLNSHKSEIELLREQVKVREKPKLALDIAEKLLQAFETDLEKAKSQEQELENTDVSLPVRAARSEKELAEASLSKAQKNRTFFTLTAPAAGEVLQIQATKGQVWGGMQQQPAIWFRPDEPWIVRCEVEQRYIYRVQVGMSCQIFDDRTDKSSWTGKVQNIGHWIRPPRIKSTDPLAWRDVHVMECIVVLDKPQPEPMIGQRVRVVFHGKPAP